MRLLHSILLICLLATFALTQTPAGQMKNLRAALRSSVLAQNNIGKNANLNAAKTATSPQGQHLVFCMSGLSITCLKSDGKQGICIAFECK